MRLRFIQDTQRVFPVIPGDKPQFFPNGCFFFSARVHIAGTVGGDDFSFFFI
ncbi:MAG: hypothetical protein LBF83_04415 [Spirochaetaceae bacterium]|nr:hypothetical protein [Spirochaetaceae bacterium]